MQTRATGDIQELFVFRTMIRIDKSQQALDLGAIVLPRIDCVVITSSFREDRIHGFPSKRLIVTISPSAATICKGRFSFALDNATENTVAHLYFSIVRQLKNAPYAHCSTSTPRSSTDEASG
jgi:hypothetical protein